MNLGQAAAVVLSLVKRPDKQAEIRASINRALEFYVKAANWSADLVEGSVAISSSSYAQSLSISAEFPRFRKICYLRPADTTRYIKYIPPDKIFTPDGCEQINTYYRAGNNLVFKLSDLSTALLYGYYQYYAYLTTDADTHWMLTACPTMITDKATSEIFDSIGADAEARRYLGYASLAFTGNEADLADGANRWNA